MAMAQCEVFRRQARMWKSAHSATVRLIEPPQFVTSRPRVPKSFTSGAAAIGYRNAFAK